jgi:hypothetical protein
MYVVLVSAHKLRLPGIKEQQNIILKIYFLEEIGFFFFCGENTGF